MPVRLLPLLFLLFAAATSRQQKTGQQSDGIEKTTPAEQTLELMGDSSAAVDELVLSVLEANGSETAIVDNDVEEELQNVDQSQSMSNSSAATAQTAMRQRTTRSQTPPMHGDGTTWPPTTQAPKQRTHAIRRRQSGESAEEDDDPEFIYPLQQKAATTKAMAKEAHQRPKDLSTSFALAEVPLMRLTKDILAPGRYDVRVRPIIDHSKPLKIHISMSLYQIIEVNEPAQNIKMNVWMIQKWHDEMLHWDPREYDMINSTILPHEVLWIPDTYLYNSVVMNAEETERYMNIRADSRYWEGMQGANMSFLYPAIYTVTCRLNIRYFPYDQQNCTLTISSWTNSKSALDYYADERVNMASFIPNEEWHVSNFRIFRHEYKYACCAEPWVILEASIVLRRKPLYYVINLIIPTSIITLVAITGFFTPASTADDRTEKINLGITTLLAMSILMLMVSDQMPTTSEFVPLIAWFYLSIIIIISIGTFLTSVILSIQGRRQYGQLPALWLRYLFFVKLTAWLWLSVPPPLLSLWEEMNDHPLVTMAKKRKAAAEQKLGNKVASRRNKKVDRPMPQISEESTDGATATRSGHANGGEAVPSLGAQQTNESTQPLRSPFLAPPTAPSDESATSSAENLAADAEPDSGQPSPRTPRSGSQRTAGSRRSPRGSKRAHKNWLRVGSIMSKRSQEGRLSPRTSPRGEMGASNSATAAGGGLQLSVLSSSRQSSLTMGNWEQAIGGLGVAQQMSRAPSISGPSGGAQTLSKVPSRVGGMSAVMAEVNSMKVKRQCSLEWEFIATILDRLFLIIFMLTVTVVTAGIMVVGRVAQWHYERAALEADGG